MSAPVTVVSCLYGDRGYERFVEAWAASLDSLDRQPHDAIVGSDRARVVPGALVLADECHWVYPKAFHLQQAILAAETEWVWILDIDDLALPGALDGVEQVSADVWQTGYQRADDSVYTPPQVTASEYLGGEGNPFTAGSMIRTEAFRRCGGFPDVAFEDWGLWRRLAQRGATFQASDRAHYRYIRHGQTRSKLELLPAVRSPHIVEMLESEVASVSA